MSSVKEILVSSVEARPEEQLREAIAVLQLLQNDFMDKGAIRHLIRCLNCLTIIENLSYINGDRDTQRLVQNIRNGNCCAG